MEKEVRDTLERSCQETGRQRLLDRARPRLLHGKRRVLGHYIHTQFLLLAVFEWLAISLLSMLLVRGVGFMQPLLVVQDSTVTFLIPLLMALCLSLTLASVGLYDTRQRESRAGVGIRVIIAALLAFLVSGLVLMLLPGVVISWLAVVSYFVAAVALLLLIRLLFYRFVDGKALRRRVLVLGAGRKAAYIDRLRRKSDLRSFFLLGYVAEPGQEIRVQETRVLTLEQPLNEYAIAHNVDEIVIAHEERRQVFPARELLDCKLSGMEVIDLLDFLEREQGKIELDLLRPSWLIFTRGFEPDMFRTFKKRSLDVIASLLLLVVAAPFMLITAAAIVLEGRGRGPVLYRQQRVGCYGELFDVIKFRSMRTDAEAAGAQWAQKDDPRVTRVGAVIRKYRLDELPQLWNVLVGDMSLVGPRPERPEFVEHLADINPLYPERHRISPGVTGWAQLCYPYGASDADSIQKLKYDLYYVKNNSLFLDIYILIQTVEVVLFKKGAR